MLASLNKIFGYFISVLVLVLSLNDFHDMFSPNILLSTFASHVIKKRYGEGWDFGEVAKNARGVNASQFNLCGTGIGR